MENRYICREFTFYQIKVFSLVSSRYKIVFFRMTLQSVRTSGVFPFDGTWI